MVAVVGVVEVVPPLPMLNLVHICRRIVEVPKAPHLRADMVTRHFSWLALVMAADHLRQRLALRTNEGQWAGARAVAEVVALSTPLMALQEFSEPAGQMGASWHWTLGVARMASVVLPAVVVAHPDRLELLTFFLECLPRLYALSMARAILVAALVAGLHFHHFFLHELVEAIVQLPWMCLITQPPALMERCVFLR